MSVVDRAEEECKANHDPDKDKDGYWKCVIRVSCTPGNDLDCVVAVVLAAIHGVGPPAIILPPSPDKQVDPVDLPAAVQLPGGLFDSGHPGWKIVERVRTESRTGAPSMTPAEVVQVAAAFQHAGFHRQAVEASQQVVTILEAQPDLQLDVVHQALALKSTSLAALGRHADATEALSLSRIIQRSGGQGGA